MADNEKKINLDLTMSSSPKNSSTGARILLNVKAPVIGEQTPRCNRTKLTSRCNWIFTGEQTRGGSNN